MIKMIERTSNPETEVEESVEHPQQLAFLEPSPCEGLVILLSAGLY